MQRVGIDITAVDRLESVIRRHPQVLTRLFAAEELVDAGIGPERARRLAARFAAKEAFVKAAQGLHGGSWRDIEVRRRANRAPYFVFHGPIDAWMKAEGLTAEVSLSHERRYATAVVLITEGDA
ncbi:MAG: holo-ACP synthase [Firmicutes bacterium]|nr:holo-ACP synthase [Bacillota bacterium]